MIEEDAKVDLEDLPPQFEIADVCTIHINRETGCVEIFSMDLEVLTPEGKIVGTISLTGDGVGQPICSIPLNRFEWTYVAPLATQHSDLKEASR